MYSLKAMLLDRKFWRECTRLCRSKRRHMYQNVLMEEM